MLFHTLDFAVFLPTVFLLYWFATQGDRKTQNVLLVCASYIFYGWWDWRFLSLMLLSTLVDYSVARALSSQKGIIIRKGLLGTSILVNLGVLGLFKYHGFFIGEFSQGFSFMGQEIKAGSLNIILPLGISFYTLQTLGYSIDVYRRKVEPASDFVAFSAFVAFFPQLVAGPIERANNLLPQFYGERRFDNGKAVDGLRQMLWGLFKKVVIADNCAPYVNMIFANPSEYSGSTLVMGAVLFAVQIYCDFSGYSDIAIGTSRLFGFELKRNFAFPYFSRDIAEFWRRWHISLSTWFRDYLYIPLGGSRTGRLTTLRNTLLIFIVSGVWHGANWTFVAWGLLHALFFLPLVLLNKNRVHLGIVGEGRWFPTLSDLVKIGVTFALTVMAWIFFRAESINHALSYFSGIFSVSLFSFPDFIPKTVILFSVFFLAIEWLGRGQQYAIEILTINSGRPIRWGVYLGLVLTIFFFYPSNPQEFIYFQF